MQPRIKLTSSNFYYRRTPGFAAILRIRYSKQKITMFVLYLPSTHSRVQHNFYRTADSTYSLKIHFVTMLQVSSAPKQKFNISKIQPYIRAKRYRTEIRCHGASRLISFSFTLQEDTRTWNKIWKNHLSTSNVYSISVNPDTFSFSQ